MQKGTIGASQRFTFRIVGAPRLLVGDAYHHLLKLGWGQLLLAGSTGYIVANLLFAGMFLLGGDCVQGARPGHFGDAFFFSVQTLSTIGYGAMSPMTGYAHALVTIESFLGLVAVAVATGLMFAKFSRPQARVGFADVIVVHERHGVPCLMVRMANERDSPAVAVHYGMSALVDEVTPEGESMRRMLDLRLERAHAPLFTMAFTLIHRLDERSPLHGLTQDDIVDRLRLLMVTFSGTDSTLLAQVHAQRMYYPDEFRFGHRYLDMIETAEDGTMEMHHPRLHLTEPVG
jgi:inward rectifier potassium channel